MYGVDLYGLVRRMVMRDGLSHREAARRFGIDRKLLRCGGSDSRVPEELASRLIVASRQRFGRSVETIIAAIECASEGGHRSLRPEHFAEAWSMQEGCDLQDNIFEAEDWLSVQLDAGADEYEAARSRRLDRKLERGRRMQLVPVLPPLAGASIASWFARVARYHADMSSHDFSSIIQLSREDIVRATDYCIGRLTAQALRPPAATARQAAACSTTVVRNSRRTSRADGIPRTCLLEDRDPLGPSLGLRVGYVNWFFRPVRACERHGQELVRRRHQHYSEQFQDLEIVAPDDGQLEREAGEGASLSVSPLQTYTERRFQGATGPSWLDGQMIDQAAKAC